MQSSCLFASAKHKAAKDSDSTAQHSMAQHGTAPHSTAQHGTAQHDAAWLSTAWQNAGNMTVQDMKLTWGFWRTRNSTQNLPLQLSIHTAKCQQHDSTAYALKLVLPDSFLPAQAVSAGPHSQETIPTPQAARSDVLNNLLDFLRWIVSL